MSAREKPTPPRPPVSVRGRGRELRIVVAESGDAAVLADELQRQFARRGGGFFDGAQVALELPKGRIDLAIVEAIGREIERAGLQLVEVTTGSPREPDTRDRPAAEGEGSRPPESEGALWVDRTLRSGQRVEYAGPVVVFGDVNAGAEVVAGGSVVVWGRLLGIVDAGRTASGCIVCALDLSPMQLRIGDAIARAPDEPSREPVPEVAWVEGGRIVVEPWGR